MLNFQKTKITYDAQSAGFPKITGFCGSDIAGHGFTSTTWQSTKCGWLQSFIDRSNNKPDGHVWKDGNVFMQRINWLHEPSTGTFDMIEVEGHWKHCTLCDQSHICALKWNKYGDGQNPCSITLFAPQKKNPVQSVTSVWNEPTGRPVHWLDGGCTCCALAKTVKILIPNTILTEIKFIFLFINHLKNVF